jgi:uncharacterized protein YndB with AHSA1/START domain
VTERERGTPEMEARTRAIEHRIEIAASPDAVWRALTEADQLASWFPVDARVTPGAGGSIWVSWAGAATYETRIRIWEPSKRLQLVEKDVDIPAGQPVAVAQDFYIEGKGGTTVLRFVHSGFSPDAQWDEMFEMMQSGWRYFFFHLKHYLEHHAPTRRRMVFARVPVPRASSADDWQSVLRGLGIDPDAAEGDAYTLTLGDERLSGTIVQRKRPYHFAGTLPDVNDGLLFIEFEPGQKKWHLGFWLSTYDVEDARVQELQAKVDAAIPAVAGSAGT